MCPISWGQYNLLSPLKRMGLIDNDGKPTERAIRWRDNDQYASVCEEIRREVYPHELLDIYPDADSPRANIENWFASTAHVGEQAKKKMAILYLLLAEADYTEQDSTSQAKTPKAGKSTPSPLKKSTPTVKNDKVMSTIAVSPSTEEAPRINERNLSSMEPSLHIDIQIHIASDASSTQIDQIFASMAKHFYRNKDINE